MKVPRATKVAGATFLGFCAVSLAADKLNLSPIASQVAGFIGGFLGSIAAQRREVPAGKQAGPATPSSAPPPGD